MRRGVSVASAAAIGPRAVPRLMSGVVSRLVARPVSRALWFAGALPVGALPLGAHVPALDVPAVQDPEPAPRVVEARVEARPDPTGLVAHVRIDYRLRPEGRDTVPLRAVEFFGSALEAVEVREADGVRPREGGSAPLDLRRAPSGSLVGALVLADPDASETAVTVTYAVRLPAGVADGRFDVTLPLVMVDWAPIEAREELFSARVDLPSDHAVIETFPMVPRQVEASGSSHAHTLTLPVVPSMLRFRGRIGSAPLLTLERWVDLGVAGVLLLLATVGWRALRRHETARRRAGASSAGGPA